MSTQSATMSNPRSTASHARKDARSRTAPIAISLFAGAGGLDLGVTAAGFRVAAANEYDHDAADTLEKNFCDELETEVDRRSILEVPTPDLLRSAGLGGHSRPDLLVGGPPCTPFSKSGFWLNWKREGLDPDASLLQEYTRILREAKPRAFILENVYALTFDSRSIRVYSCKSASIVSWSRYSGSALLFVPDFCRIVASDL